MRLYRAASAEGCQNGKDGKQDSQPLDAQTAFDGVHRAAGHRAILEADAVLNRQERFCILSGDTEHAGHPAPEHRAGAAECDCGRDTDDIARADGRRECGCQRTELRDIAVRAVIGLGG